MKKIITFENDKAVIKVDLNGGAYIDFHLKDLPINPINWSSSNPDEPLFQGYFLCFDRWGLPSDAEKKNGFIHHGEVNQQQWGILQESKTGSSMQCSLPVARLQLTRESQQSPHNEPVVRVKEHIKNLNKNSRLYNLVQHVTLAPPFLDKSTLFDNNTEKGFEDGVLCKAIEDFHVWTENVKN
ncbi:MAG: hypothetical protein BWY08_00542 [Bacteroidetes bacterium ADurb.Bin174]|jgi:hypothetical protein|nr:MAG: hypothetical protein BWY08_00542 [Bacteroidetes bacterium ADurb.Bin174]